jgi:hypothetical protein
MAIPTHICIPVTIPASLQPTQNYNIQFSLYSPELNQETFIEKLYSPSELTRSASGGYTAVLPRANLPRFRGETECGLRAHFWKGSKLIGTEELGRV